MTTINKNIPQAGFTLFELLIAIVLIGTLGTWVITLINPAQQFKRGRDAERKSELRQIQTALELYRADQGVYPNSEDYPDTAGLPPCGSSIAVEDKIYIQKIPCDPRDTGEYIYNYISTGATYSLITCLENVNDSQKDETNKDTYCLGGDDNWSYTLDYP